jgi:hypothetical protein
MIRLVRREPLYWEDRTMTTAITKLADYDNPIVKNKAEVLTRGHNTIEEKIAAIFYYVRDDIKFQLPAEGDLIKASRIIEYGYGQCNNKTTLALALCKAINIEARVHFSLIDKETQRGLITGLFYWIIPKTISHSWLEVKVHNQWFRIDSYINDNTFYHAGKRKLQERGWHTGYSIAGSKKKSSAELDFNNQGFVQMDAVTGDHGVYDDPMEDYWSSQYKNRPNGLTLFIYKLFIRGVNEKVKRMRYSYAAGQ